MRSSAMLLVRTDSVSDGCTDADDVAGSEDVSVVQHVIVADFRPDEDVAPEVVTNARTQIDQEVV